MATIQFQTISEEHFAAYLDNAGHRWDYEPGIPGQSKKPDFAFLYNGTKVLCEVKQRMPSAAQLEADEHDAELLAAGERPTRRARNFDPVAQVRHLVKKGWEKFNGFDGHLCILVIYNNGNRDTRLNPTCIYGTMLGDPGITANLSPQGIVDIGSVQSAFLPWTEKYRRRYEALKNISAVVALDSYRIPNPAFDEAFNVEAKRQWNLLGRPLAIEESVTIRQDLIFDRGMHMTIGETQGVTVCANPFAAIQFPDGLFNGPFDECWSIVDGEMKRVFVGEQRLALNRQFDTDSEEEETNPASPTIAKVPFLQFFNRLRKRFIRLVRFALHSAT